MRQEYGFSRGGGDSKNYAVNVKGRGLSQRPFDGNYDDQAPINPQKSGRVGVR